MKKLIAVFSEVWKAVDPGNLDVLFDKVAKSRLPQKEKARLLSTVARARIIYAYWLLLLITLLLLMVVYWLMLHSGEIQLTLG